MVFTAEDLAVFRIPGFPECMAALRQRLSPCLGQIAQALKAPLADELGPELHGHVAKHLRRSVNPPDGTRAALGEERRGCKMVPHFAVGMFAERLSLRLEALREAGAARCPLARTLGESLATLPDDPEPLQGAALHRNLQAREGAAICRPLSPSPLATSRARPCSCSRRRTWGSARTRARSSTRHASGLCS